jgi:glyoxylase-like metal-dependent hydrolase (beta-lactamase superfamily II)/rhodanese-related sulfurtransferase
VLPELTPQELADVAETGAPLQVVDVRSPDVAASDRIDWAALSMRDGGAVPAAFNLPTSVLSDMDDPADRGLDRSVPVAVVCAKGSASQGATRLLRNFGFDARSLRGGMAQWSVALRRHDLEPPHGWHTFTAFERFAKGRRTFLLGAGDEALVVDAGRNLAPVIDAARELGLTIRGVVDTHLHADVLSGGPGLARFVGCDYFLSAPDAEGGRLAARDLSSRTELSCGGNSVEVFDTPGHTRGSVSLRFGDVYLTGDFLLCHGVARVETGSGSELAESLRAVSAWPVGARLVPSFCWHGRLELRFDAALRRQIGPLRGVAEQAQAAELDERERQLQRANRGLETIDQATVRRLEAGTKDLHLDGARWAQAC